MLKVREVDPFHEYPAQRADPPRQAEYAACILFIASLCFAKLSVVAFMIELTPIRAYKRASYFLGLVIIGWTVSSIFAASFQCDLERPWDFVHTSCFNRVRFNGPWKAFIKDTY